ncbi:hypothetical protein [Xanthobacter tagetidis]|jgi:hypothetical protein|uniref:Uncharacterized protein n=1 Tax=Xanthobacter tagetidis TaxID=60216 RepID=A0A3L7A194_9HYPH|nr:hypothetical protein [Xanthobacter tagetidis]MBB6307217.1 hypothetical protein [Xanthobacter tagetidis]RLP74053.1 hypothetical protein D9R14_19955 [Xanthobacter tagetidis]
MRYTVIAAISAALLSTTAFAPSAFAQDTSSKQQQTHRAYAPVVTPTTQAPAFPGEQIDRQRNPASSISEADRLFLLQGDRGLGNG